MLCIGFQLGQCRFESDAWRGEPCGSLVLRLCVCVCEGQSGDCQLQTAEKASPDWPGPEEGMTQVIQANAPQGVASV